MALPAILEIGANLLPLAFDLAIYVIVGMGAPVRFLFSRIYRSEVTKRWRRSPWLALVQVPGSLFLLVAGLWILWVWGTALAGMMAHNKQAADARKQRTAERPLWQQGLQKLQEHRAKAERES